MLFSSSQQPSPTYQEEPHPAPVVVGEGAAVVVGEGAAVVVGEGAAVVVGEGALVVVVVPVQTETAIKDCNIKSLLFFKSILIWQRLIFHK